MPQPALQIPRPQDDYYGHVNAAWAIPHDVPWISPYVVNTLRVQDRIKQLVEAAAAGTPAAGTDAQRIGDLYRSYTGEARIEAAGLAPLQSELARIDAIRSADDLAGVLGRLGRVHTSVDPNNRLPDVGGTSGFATRTALRDIAGTIGCSVPVCSQPLLHKQRHCGASKLRKYSPRMNSCA